MFTVCGVLLVPWTGVLVEQLHGHAVSDPDDRCPGVCFFDLNEEGQIARITDFWPAPADEA